MTGEERRCLKRVANVKICLFVGAECLVDKGRDTLLVKSNLTLVQ